MGVSEKTVHRYKQAFHEMECLERDRVVAALMAEWYNDTVNAHRKGDAE